MAALGWLMNLDFAASGVGDYRPTGNKMLYERDEGSRWTLQWKNQGVPFKWAISYSTD